MIRKLTLIRIVKRRKLIVFSIVHQIKEATFYRTRRNHFIYSASATKVYHVAINSCMTICDKFASVRVDEVFLSFLRSVENNWHKEFLPTVTIYIMKIIIGNKILKTKPFSLISHTAYIHIEKNFTDQ